MAVLMQLLRLQKDGNLQLSKTGKVTADKMTAKPSAK